MQKKSPEEWIVHKFGGTSVLNAERYRHVSQIIKGLASANSEGIVVSAMKGVTDDLLQTVDLARRQEPAYVDLLEKIHQRHRGEIASLIGGDRRDDLLRIVDDDFRELGEILRGIWLLKEAGENIYARLSGMGEVWSAQILNSYFLDQGENCDWLDAREVLVIKTVQNRVYVEWTQSAERLAKWRKNHPAKRVIITGFVARTESGTMTTLGRNGSDYSASIFARLFSADEVYIWTDVDGVMSADPNQVPDAIVLDEMSYSEVTELAYFGAKVVHPATMAPAVEKKIPIWIKNTFKPTLPGTKIHEHAKSDRAVKGFSTIHNMALLNLEGAGLVGVVGAAERLFAALRAASVNVVLISQASSEQSICVAISEDQAGAARAAIDETFAVEIQKGLIQPSEVTNSVSVLAAVGDNMAHTPGVSGRFFTALGRSGVNIRAIAQGSSERNISVIVETKEALRALRTVHSSFILPHQRVSIGVIGPGLIGATFLKQIGETQIELRERRKLDLQVRAIANSTRMLLSETEISLGDWQSRFASQSEALDLEKFARHVRPDHIPHGVIVEATASEALVPYYSKWLKQGLHVITPNKKANSGSLQSYREIRQTALAVGRHFLYSTNVGAGLPILQTLRDLCATGDQISLLMGMLSGTLSYIFNSFDGSRPFSEIVKEAKSKGYTEPDPREDLGGVDVARKLVILAREAGLAIELKDVCLQGLVPKELQKVSVEEFLGRMTEMDSEMSRLVAQAQKQSEVLRFVASLTFDSKTGGKAEVALRSLSRSHVFAQAQGTDNVILFQTRRYHDRPLVIQGPGAGPEVTAAGVFADLLRLTDLLESWR